MELEKLLDLISWEAMATPLVMGLVIAAFMVLFGMAGITAFLGWLWHKRHPDKPLPEELQERGAAVNFGTFLLALGLSVWRLWGEEPGPIMVLALLATIAAIVLYEVVKNLLKLGGVDVKRFSLLGTGG